MYSMWLNASSVVNPIFGTVNLSCTLFLAITCVEIVLRTVSFYQASFQVFFMLTPISRHTKRAMIKLALSAIDWIYLLKRSAWRALESAILGLPVDTRAMSIPDRKNAESCESHWGFAVLWTHIRKSTRVPERRGGAPIFLMDTCDIFVTFKFKFP